jgi:hypothetical protein
LQNTDPAYTYIAGSARRYGMTPAEKAADRAAKKEAKRLARLKAKADRKAAALRAKADEVDELAGGVAGLAV